ncbi:MAG: hypothetical protein J5I28_05815 [Acidimicrobiales bacterium]|jgi:hypothetical protein|nr:hypothetical protein [Acidimicrobiales bacterium]HLV90900.1 hypothetical protein [Acidimicrobiia bacterium]
MTEEVIPTFAHLDDDELMDRYRKSKGPNRLMRDEDTALEAEMRRRGLMPDREDTIPEEPPQELPGATGPIETIEPGPVSETDNGR